MNITTSLNQRSSSWAGGGLPWTRDLQN